MHCSEIKKFSSAHSHTHTHTMYSTPWFGNYFWNRMLLWCFFSPLIFYLSMFAWLVNGDVELLVCTAVSNNPFNSVWKSSWAHSNKNCNQIHVFHSGEWINECWRFLSHLMKSDFTNLTRGHRQVRMDGLNFVQTNWNPTIFRLFIEIGAISVREKNTSKYFEIMKWLPDDEWIEISTGRFHGINQSKIQSKILHWPALFTPIGYGSIWPSIRLLRNSRIITSPEELAWFRLSVTGQFTQFSTKRTVLSNPFFLCSDTSPI